MKDLPQKYTYVLVGIILSLLAVSSVSIYKLNSLQKSYEDREKDYKEQEKELQEEIAQAKGRVATLENDLEYEQDKNVIFEEQIQNISGTVGRLDKLARTDEELLQKYSKVYFLNEHYTPEALVSIPKEYVYNSEEKDLEIHAKVYTYLNRLLEEAEEDGVNLEIISSYRSYGTQANLKSHYNVVYGSGTANQFSADQGYSEHQLGTTVDFSTKDREGSLQDFDSTKAYEWLQQNAYRFGFTLSYPEENSYYVFEPWHWRYVGQDLATKLHKEDLHFYDLTQREIDEYLISLFD